MPEEILTLPGLIDDPRSAEAKARDYTQKETAPMAVLLKWDRDISGAPFYAERDQDGSGTCVPQSGAKGLETLRGEVISARPPYPKRSNFPSAGMWLQDFGNIIRHIGTDIEARVPSQRMNEGQMNQPFTGETPINGYLYAFANVKDIDQIATAIEVYKHCLITIYANGTEYSPATKPVAILNAELNVAHSICGIYYFTDENGEKCILIDESWGPNQIRRRIFTETYLKIRGTGAMYFIPPAVEPIVPKKPKYRFTVPLIYGQSSYGIKMLQDILKYENLFPINIPSTGNYLQVTAKWVYAWQVKHKVAPLEELNAIKPLGGRVGAKTIKKLNELYAQ